MGFFKDILSGGGDLHKKIMPKELRKMGIKEIEPGGFDPARDWFGFDIKANPERDAMLARQQQMQAAQGAFDQGPMGIPGVNAPTGGGEMIPGLLGRPFEPPSPPGLTEIPNQQQPVAQFQPQGPYGQTAMQMAGLLAQPQADPNLPGGLLGDPRKRPLVPRYRPNGK